MAYDAEGNYVRDVPQSWEVYRQHVTEARSTARTEGSFDLCVEQGGEGSGQVMELWYDLGLTKPRRAPKGFRGLWAFAYSQQLEGEPRFVGVFVANSEFQAHTRQARLKAQGWTIHGTTWDGDWFANPASDRPESRQDIAPKP